MVYRNDRIIRADIILLLFANNFCHTDSLSIMAAMGGGGGGGGYCNNARTILSCRTENPYNLFVFYFFLCFFVCVMSFRVL